MTVFLRPPEIVSPASAPPITGQAGFVPFEYPPVFLLPLPPVVVPVVPFHLVGSRSRTPKKPSRELEGRLRHPTPPHQAYFSNDPTSPEDKIGAPRRTSNVGRSWYA